MTSTDDRERLRILAQHYGIADHYFDIWGVRHETSDDTRRAILTAMGVSIATEEELAHAVSSLHVRYWHRLCDPVLVLRDRAKQGVWSLRFPSHPEQDGRWTCDWALEDEAGTVVRQGVVGPGLPVLDVTTVNGVRYIRCELAVPEGLPDGYYDLKLSCHHGAERMVATSLLVIAPLRCYLPPSFQAESGTWGIWAQLYSLQSRRNWGIGDFTDLARLVRWASELGAGAVGINPLHSLKNTKPFHISPYSPQSRAFLNEIYLDVERIPEYARCGDAQALMASEAFRLRLATLRNSQWVDYEGVHRAKLEMLELLYRQFVADATEAGRVRDAESTATATTRAEAFARYRREQGQALEGFALFLALSEHFSRQSPPCVTWRDWPAAYRHPGSPAVEEFRLAHQARIGFFQYVQWQAQEQLAAVARSTKELGMLIGLYHDFALGSDPSGAEGWLLQDVLVHGADCGAPPDPFALQGQNWGFPPFHPLALRDQGYRPFISLLRQNVTRGGALRLDHVMGLFRLFWIPKGRSAADGAYVEYPYEDLLGILALESQRAGTVVIGEDLGTVPEWIRDRLGEVCTFSYRVWYFERGPDGAWNAPDRYPAHSLAVSTTHDLPTLPGFWQGDDLHIRERLGLLPQAEDRQRAWDERARDKERMLETLRAFGELPAGDEASHDSPIVTTDIQDAVHRFLARTSSLMVLASLDDWVGETAQANVPGTLDEYPNWSRKTAVPLEDLEADEGCRRLAALMRKERGSGVIVERKAGGESARAAPDAG